jgi:hypothetical protein
MSSQFRRQNKILIRELLKQEILLPSNLNLHNNIIILLMIYQLRRVKINLILTLILNHFMNVQKDVEEALQRLHYKNMKRFVLKYFKSKGNLLMHKNIE